MSAEETGWFIRAYDRMNMSWRRKRIAFSADDTRDVSCLKERCDSSGFDVCNVIWISSVCRWEKLLADSINSYQVLTSDR